MTLLRYVLVQLVAYAIDLGGFYVLIAAGVFGPLVANVGGKMAAGIFAFFVHRRFTFGVREQSGKLSEAVRYSIVLLVNIPISSLLLAGALHVIAAPVPAKICSDIAAVGLSFLLTKYVVFGRRRARSNARDCATGPSGAE